MLASCEKDDTNEATTKVEFAPEVIREKWWDFRSEMHRAYLDDQVAVYLASDVDSNIVRWAGPNMNKVWKYTKATYGAYGEDGRLLVFAHGPEYLEPGGVFFATLAGYMDGTVNYRNMLVATSSVWQDTMTMMAVMTHEVSHIIEGSSYGIKGSPSAKLWGDSQFADIVIFDTFLAMGWNDWAQEVIRNGQTNGVNYPNPNRRNYWFRDWWYPLYMKYGKTQLLVKYMKSISENVHTKINWEGFKEYTEDLNLGEFVHFMSGAAGADLKAQAKIAFDWTMENEQQLINAKEDYPNIKY